MKKIFVFVFALFLTGLVFGNSKNVEELKVLNGEQLSQKPNLLIIHTDEHNFRTLGCYRELLSSEQALMWGPKAVVETPNIDKIAEEGLLCENWYATSPVCTPSRASMISGLNPISTGSPVNDMPLNDDIVSFGQILKNNGYATSYVGKWHLDGDAKPGVDPARNFGFEDNRYMFNRGHWKSLGEDENGLKVLDKVSKDGWAQFDPEIANRDNFTTDFLTDRTLEILERDKTQPFCLMLSIPDPHGPDKVRKPYSEMYQDMEFKQPISANIDNYLQPKWSNPEKKNKLDNFNSTGIAQYFGMVKCIDDNVGRILKYLKENDLEKNTIVVFTSDHGDLMGEHSKLNKGVPYETSARVGFVMRYPGKINPGKRIQKAYTMADFSPTVLGLMNVDHSAYSFH